MPILQVLDWKIIFKIKFLAYIHIKPLRTHKILKSHPKLLTTTHLISIHKRNKLKFSNTTRLISIYKINK